MAFDVATGTVDVPASTGTQAITGLGFQPKAILFFGVNKSADGAAASFEYTLGISTGAANNDRSLGGFSEDALTTSDAGSQIENRTTSTVEACIYLRDVGTTELLRAHIDSFDADGFTLDWLTVTSGIDVHFIALGGADLTDVFSGKLNASTSTGNVGYTGVGFQPDCVIFLDSGLAADNGTGSHVVHSLGVALSSTARWAVGGTSRSAVATSNTSRIQTTGKCISATDLFSGVEHEADLVSMDADGFTLNWTNAAAGAYRVPYLALKGGQYAVGSDTQNTSTGTKATTGVGFTPAGLMLASFNAAAAAGRQDHHRKSIGVAASTTSRRCIFLGDQNGVGTTNASQDSDTAAVIKMMTESGATPTLDAEADLSSLDADGFTLNWTTADATAREFCYLAFGDAAAGGVEAGAGSISASITVSGVGRSTHAADGSIVNISTVSGVGRSTHTAEGSLAALFSLSGAGRSTHNAQGSIVNVVTVSGVGRSTFSAAGSASALVTLAGTGTAIKSADGSISASFTVAGTGRSTFSGAGSIPITATLSGVGKIIAAAQGSIASTFTLSGGGVTIQVIAGQGVIAITSNVTAVGLALGLLLDIVLSDAAVNIITLTDAVVSSVTLSDAVVNSVNLSDSVV